MIYNNSNKNNLAFTLIELLATIIILAIIAAITTPIILNIINNSKKEAFKVTAIGLADSARDYVTTSDDNSAKTFTIKNGSFVGLNTLRVSGNLPQNGTIIVNKDFETAIAVTDGKWCAMKGFEDDEITINDDISNCLLLAEPPLTCFEYIDIGDGIEIVLYNHYDDSNESCPVDIKIPEVINDKNVISIANGSFDNHNLSQIIIPNTVTNIGATAFQRNVLATVVIPDTVITIGNGAFSDNQLSSVIIGNGVTTIGSGAFSNNQIMNLTIGNSVTTIGDGAFNSNLLASVTIPNSVTTIDGWSFEINQLENVDIGDNVTSIGENAFASNPLSSVTIGNGITSINEQAFMGCPDLLSIYIDKPRSDVANITGYNVNWGATNSFIRCNDDVMYQITTNNNDIIVPSETVGDATIRIKAKSNNQMVSSFKLNGVLVDGNSFVMPTTDANITDVTFINGYTIESNHPYSEDFDYTWTQTIAGATSVAVVFDNSTYTEDEYDSIYIYDVNDNLIGQYDNSELANQKIVVTGDTIKIRLSSDESVSYWGFKAFIYQE